MEGKASIIVGGDVCPWLRNESLFAEGNEESILQGLHHLFRGAHFTLVNLESPLISRNTPIKKSGPILGAREECVHGLKKLNIGAVTLANNHALDHGPDGLLNTMRVCTENGIKVFGAGRNLSQASQVLVQEINGLRIGFLGVADREFSIASDDGPGACPVDAMLAHSILGQAGQWDSLIVLVHAGLQGYPFPSPWLQRFCRYLVNLGAAVVVCQHSHCIGSYEMYQGALILYGQGNFIFDWKEKLSSEWYESVLLRLELSRNGLESFQLIPACQSGDKPGASVCDPGHEQRILRTLEERRSLVADPAQVRARWIQHCTAIRKEYYQMLLKTNLARRVWKLLSDRFGMPWEPFGEDHKRLIGVLVRCDSHREALETIFTVENDDL